MSHAESSEQLSTQLLSSLTRVAEFGTILGNLGSELRVALEAHREVEVVIPADPVECASLVPQVSELEAYRKELEETMQEMEEEADEMSRQLEQREAQCRELEKEAEAKEARVAQLEAALRKKLCLEESDVWSGREEEE